MTESSSHVLNHASPGPEPGAETAALDPPCLHVGILLIPDFSLMSFTCLVEPMRGANRRTGRASYRWRLLSEKGGVVSASNGLPVNTEPLPEDPAGLPDVLIVCGGHPDAGYDGRPLREPLRRAVRSGRMVGAVSTASFILAAAGLLDGRCCTTHWEYLEGFAESFPRTRPSHDRYVLDGRIFTCGGGLSAIDAMLDLIAGREGRVFAGDVAENFLHVPSERAAMPQRRTLSDRLGSADPVVLSVAALMEVNTEAPLPLPAIARQVGASQRQIERLFRRHLGRSPNEHYLATRLEKARQLLRHSRLSATEIGLSCGFASLSHFSRSYRRHFGLPPSTDRTGPAGGPGLRDSTEAGRPQPVRTKESARYGSWWDPGGT